MCTHKQSFELVTNAQEKIFSKRQRSKSIKVISVLLFSTNLIFAEFDNLRALKKEVAKDD